MKRPPRCLPALGLLALALALGACAPKEASGPPTLKIASWFGTTEGGEMNRIISAVNARHVGEFKVEQLTIPGDGEYMTKVDTMIAGQLAPDMFLLSQEYLPSYAHIGAIRDLDAQVRADAAFDLADYYPASLETASFHGHLYGMPWIMMPVVMYYNKALFDQAHLAYPTDAWDWARFEAAAKQLTATSGRSDKKHWGFLQYDWPPLQIWAWQNGGDMLNADRTKPTITDPATVEAIKFVDKLVNQDHVTPSAGTVQQMGKNELFKSGKVAMFYGGASDDFDRTPGLRVGMCQLPRGKRRATFSWGAELVMATQGKHPGETYVAFKEILDGIHHWKMVPPRKSLAAKLEQIEPRKAYAKATILASMAYARGLRGVVEQTDWDDLFTNKLTFPLMRGEVSAEAGTAASQEKLAKLLELSP